MKKMNILFRVDGSKKIGMGHITRCVDLAKELKKKGHTIEFITMDDVSAVKYLNIKGYSPKTLLSKNNTSDEIKKTNSLLKDKFYDRIIVDLLIGNHHENFGYYGNRIKVLEKLKDYCKKLIYITDDTYPEEIKKINADIIFGLSPNQRENNYENKLNVQYYMGPKYFPLNKEFEKDSIIIKDKIKKILVTMGGSDVSGHTLKVIHALQNIDMNNVDITVVIGPGNEKKYNELIKSKNISLKYNVTNMLSLMKKTDIGICSSGNTSLELLSLGVPSLSIPQTKRENEHAKEYAKRGALVKTIEFGEKVSIIEIEKYILKMINSTKLRKELNNKSRETIDGKGLKRMIEIILR